MTTTALDEFVSEVRRWGFPGEGPMFMARHIWRVTNPDKQNNISQDPRYLAYCQEQEAADMRKAGLVYHEDDCTTHKAERGDHEACNCILAGDERSHKPH